MFLLFESLPKLIYRDLGGSVRVIFRFVEQDG